MLKPLNYFFLAFFFYSSFPFMNYYSEDVVLGPSVICSAHDCGNAVKVSYPFWFMDATIYDYQCFCGHRDFGISCSKNKPILRISNGDYYVRNINYTCNTITVVDIDAASRICPIARYSVAFGDVTVNYSNLGSNTTFYFSCTSKPLSYSISDIEFMRFSTLKSYIFTMEGGIVDVDWIKDCEEKVAVMVMRAEIIGSSMIGGVGGAMNQGFILNWKTVKECDNCEASNEFCGYNYTVGKTFCFCSDMQNSQCKGLAIGEIGMLITCCLIYCFKKIPLVTLIVSLKEKNQDFEAFLKSHGPLAVKRYSFSEVKKMTNFFNDKLGKGGYGSVYKGKLNDGRFVAVKVLNASKGVEEFINEVASISRTSHVNIVTLLGFCLEGQNRALVYDFMPNGSLEKFIRSRSILRTNSHLGWKIIHEIAIGIARGLEYLHHWCNTRIVHFDIKPSNILLDENFCPRISDFGLAKLYTKKESILSMLQIRGTIGYIAPEVFNKNFGKASHKSDVYSYGMMVLEIVGGREKDAVETNDSSSERYFPYWIYKRLEIGNESEFYGGISTEETEIVRKMTLVGLWCIQTNPSDRPSMSKVIEMLQGSIENLKIPPIPILSSPPKSPPFCSFTTAIA